MEDFVYIFVYYVYPAIAFILSFWWIFAVIFLFRIFQKLWLDYAQDQYLASIDWVLLEIKIPKTEDHSPKIVENIFAGLHGVQSNRNVLDTYIGGKLTAFFSLEIVGIDGKVHFLIRTPKEFRNLVESAIYSRYSEAEIFEVDDYTENVPKDIPNRSYNLWGTEFVLVKDPAYPIRTYPYFKDIISEAFIDPLASLTEVINSLEKGEQIWLQFVIMPTMDQGWINKGIKIIEKITGRPSSEIKETTVVDLVKKELVEFPRYLVQATYKEPEPVKPEEEKKKEKPSLLSLTFGEQEVIKAIENNIGKLGFETKFRFIYLGRKELFSKSRVAAIMGVFKQFAVQDMNGFKPDGLTKTGVDYFFVKTRTLYRQRRIFTRYKQRNLGIEKKLFLYKANPSFVLNIESLATLYHFPSIEVKTSTMTRVESKRGVAPKNLPVL